LRRHFAKEDYRLGGDDRRQLEELGTPLDADEAVEKARQIHPLLGSHQEMAIRALAKAHPHGLPASAINPKWSSMPNTYTTLDKLADLGLARRQEGRPRRYYLGPKMV
jgi:hypothetical protein